MYEWYSLPNRKTKYTAGYDFFSLKDFVLKPGEKNTTGIKADMD